MTTTRLADEQAHDVAERRLAELAGRPVDATVVWDPEHHLQGHVEIDGEHVVLIAPRDCDHEPLLLTESAWDELRRVSMALD